MPLNSLLAAAAAMFFLVYWAFNFIVLYHLDRFGVGTQPKKFAAVFLLGSVILFTLSIVFFTSIDFYTLNEVVLFNFYGIK